MYNIHNNTASSYLSQHFTKIQNLHNHSTRTAEHNFVVPRVQGLELYNFNYQGVKLWNELPAYIQGSKFKSDFKSKVKHFIKISSQFIFYTVLKSNWINSDFILFLIKLGIAK